VTIAGTLYVRDPVIHDTFILLGPAKDTCICSTKVLLLCQKFQKKEKKDFKDQDIILEDQN
jgi:hypothetical protein